MGTHADFALTAIINVTAARLALVVAMNKHARHSRTTARAGVDGFERKKPEESGVELQQATLILLAEVDSAA